MIIRIIHSGLGSIFLERLKLYVPSIFDDYASVLDFVLVKETNEDSEGEREFCIGEPASVTIQLFLEGVDLLRQDPEPIEAIYQRIEKNLISCLSPGDKYKIEILKVKPIGSIEGEAIAGSQAKRRTPTLAYS
jgi:hypothetical protein